MGRGHHERYGHDVVVVLVEYRAGRRDNLRGAGCGELVMRGGGTWCTEATRLVVIRDRKLPRRKGKSRTVITRIPIMVTRQARDDQIRLSRASLTWFMGTFGDDESAGFLRREKANLPPSTCRGDRFLLAQSDGPICSCPRCQSASHTQHQKCPRSASWRYFSVRCVAQAHEIARSPSPIIAFPNLDRSRDGRGETKAWRSARPPCPFTCPCAYYFRRCFRRGSRRRC